MNKGKTVNSNVIHQVLLDSLFTNFVFNFDGNLIETQLLVGTGISFRTDITSVFFDDYCIQTVMELQYQKLIP